MRKHGPGTAGRNNARDAKICARRAFGVSFEKLGQEFKLSRERARQIVRRAERISARNKAIRTKWRGVFANTR
jgi:DNA-directed RNA polymerase sigma subunit (sigma70/sigma32)